MVMTERSSAEMDATRTPSIYHMRRAGANASGRGAMTAPLPGGIVRGGDVRARRPRTQEARRSGRGHCGAPRGSATCGRGRPRTQEARRSGRRRRCRALRGSAGLDRSDHWRAGRNDCALPGNAAASGNVRAGCPRSRAPPSAGLGFSPAASRGAATCGRDARAPGKRAGAGGGAVAGHCGAPWGSTVPIVGGRGVTAAPFPAMPR